jgi:hypothetical protein
MLFSNSIVLVVKFQGIATKLVIFSLKMNKFKGNVDIYCRHKLGLSLHLSLCINVRGNITEYSCEAKPMGDHNLPSPLIEIGITYLKI